MDSPAKTTAEQIDVWREAKSEDEHLEFKEAKNNFDYKTLLGYCVAFANERGGKLLLGIANWPPRPVVGTNAFPDTMKIAKAIFDKFGFRVDIEEVQHPEGRVLVFHIPSRPTGHPYHLDGSYLMRVGESLVPMTQDQLKQIFAEGRSYRRVAIITTTLALLVVGVIGFQGLKHWNTALPPAQQETEKKSAETPPTTDAKHLEQKPNTLGRSSPTPKSKNAQTNGRVDWRDKHNWRTYLRVGMSKKEVRVLFGEAQNIRVYSDMETWSYGSGEITFIVRADSPDGDLYSWDEPDR